MSIEQAIVYSVGHIEIVRCQATLEEAYALCATADGYVDLVEEDGYIDVWGTTDDGAEYRLHITPVSDSEE